MQIVWPSTQDLSTESDDDRYDADGARLLITVDGTHCPIFEPEDPELSKNPKYYSHKINQAALNYELGILVTESRLVWVNGPFPAATHDITVFRRGLIHMIPRGSKAIGDAGYRGEPNYISTKNVHAPRVVEKFKSRARSRHETFNSRIKAFGSMFQRFRHGVVKHKIAFMAICVICQYQMECGSPLFDVVV
jgi:DDE superfamily endonuclease